MTDQELLELAKEMGFSAALIPMEKIVVDAKFRSLCEENLCGNYDANYACPPDCGSVSSVRQRLMAEDRALVLETVWEIGSYENTEGILDARKAHNAAILRLSEKLRQAGFHGFYLGYGGCPLCSPCKRSQNLPCAYPERKISCLSAYCVDVAKLAEECGMEFAWTPEKLHLFGMFAFKTRWQANRKESGMKHSMQLTPAPFRMIKNGTKTIELRLYDEKRQKIHVGDTIRFLNTETAEELSVTVKDLFVFESFDELYRHLPLTQCGYTEEDVDQARPEDMLEYYSMERQRKYGVVGIQIERK